jgi:hypothetical protein
MAVEQCWNNNWKGNWKCDRWLWSNAGIITGRETGSVTDGCGAMLE